MVSRHVGSCHCGGIRFSVNHEVTELTASDCSLCVKRNAVMGKVPEAALSIDQGRELLATTSGTACARSIISADAAASTSSVASAQRPIISASISFAGTVSIRTRCRSA